MTGSEAVGFEEQAKPIEAALEKPPTCPSALRTAQPARPATKTELLKVSCLARKWDSR